MRGWVYVFETFAKYFTEQKLEFNLQVFKILNYFGFFKVILEYISFYLERSCLNENSFMAKINDIKSQSKIRNQITFDLEYQLDLRA